MPRTVECECFLCYYRAHGLVEVPVIVHKTTVMGRSFGKGFRQSAVNKIRLYSRSLALKSHLVITILPWRLN